MKAVYRGQPYKVVDEVSNGLALQHWLNKKNIEVPFSEPSLVVDPTDDQWSEALDNAEEID